MGNGRSFGIGRRPTAPRSLKTDDEILVMRQAGLLVGQTLAMLAESVAAGQTTGHLDERAEDFIRSHGGRPSFAEVPGYRHTLCTSTNDEVVHGIPGDRVLVDGDLLSIDCGAIVGGWHGDAAISLIVGGREAGRPEDLALMDATEASMWAGIAAMVVGERLFAVGAAVEDSIMESRFRDDRDYGIVADYVGHAIGREMHLDPQIPNYRVRAKGPVLRSGFTGAIEPMVTLGSPETRVLDDDWTVVTDDGSRASHWEHTALVRDDGLWVLTALDGGKAALGAVGAPYAPLGA